MTWRPGTLVTIAGNFNALNAHSVMLVRGPMLSTIGCVGVTVTSTQIQCTVNPVGGPTALGLWDLYVADNVTTNAFRYNNAFTLEATLTITATETLGGANNLSVFDGITATAGPVTGGSAFAVGTTTTPLRRRSRSRSRRPATWTWGGNCGACAANSSPCALAITTSPLTCTVTAP